MASRVRGTVWLRPRLRERRRERRHNEKRHNCENAHVLRHVSKSYVYPRAPKGIGAFSKMMRSLHPCYNITMTIRAIRRISESDSYNNYIIIFCEMLHQCDILQKLCKMLHQCLLCNFSEFIISNSAMLFYILDSTSLFVLSNILI